MKDVTEGKAVLFRQRNVQPVVGSGSLKLEIETAAKAFPQRQSPGFVDARAKGSVNDQLHAPGFIKKALGYDRALRRNIAQNSTAFENVLHGLRGAGFLQPALLPQPSDRLRHLRSLWRQRHRRNSTYALADLSPEFRHMKRELFGTRRCLSSPERNTGGRAMRVFHQYAT